LNSPFRKITSERGLKYIRAKSKSVQTLDIRYLSPNVSQARNCGGGEVPRRKFFVPPGKSVGHNFKLLDIV